MKTNNFFEMKNSALNLSHRVIFLERFNIIEKYNFSYQNNRSV